MNLRNLRAARLLRRCAETFSQRRDLISEFRLEITKKRLEKHLYAVFIGFIHNCLFFLFEGIQVLGSRFRYNAQFQRESWTFFLASSSLSNNNYVELLFHNDLPLTAKKSSKVKVTLCQARTSPSGFAVPYNFSNSLTCGFAFRKQVFSCLDM